MPCRRTIEGHLGRIPESIWGTAPYCSELADDHHRRVGKTRVARLMRAARLQGLRPRRFVTTTIGDPTADRALGSSGSGVHCSRARIVSGWPTSRTSRHGPVSFISPSCSTSGRGASLAGPMGARRSLQGRARRPRKVEARGQHRSMTGSPDSLRSRLRSMQLCQRSLSGYAVPGTDWIRSPPRREHDSVARRTGGPHCAAGLCWPPHIDRCRPPGWRFVHRHRNQCRWRDRSCRSQSASFTTDS